MQNLNISRLIYLLFIFSFSVANAQDFSKVDNWLKNNADNMGGRAYLMIYKDSKVIYSKGEGNLNTRQKLVSKMIAKRQDMKADLESYTSVTRQQIASCSKWLSAALVMTFVDEGKLKITDTIGKYLPVMSQHGKGKITIAQCLSHTTAIKVPSLKESLTEMKDISSMDEAMAQIALLPMEGEPGKIFHYSNEGL